MFRTKVQIPSHNFEIDYNSSILSMGSCFVENIGYKLQNARFLSFINPFGALYNPLSLANSLHTLLSDSEFTEADLFEHASLWHSFAHSSAFSATSSEESLQMINSRLAAARYFLAEADVLILTFGAAWIFEEIQSGSVVANCHKLPASHFKRRRLSVDEIVKAMSAVFTELISLRPKLKIVLTVSPIRHWKDGAQENTISKSTLHLAINKLTEQFSYTHYFPAYEIVMDELRDYRFYAADMLHPSDVAVKYIWEQFSNSFFSKETIELKKRLEQIYADENHRPLHEDSVEYKRFFESIERKKQKLIEEFPFLKSRFD